jgi:hypothetical protein
MVALTLFSAAALAAGTGCGSANDGARTATTARSTTAVAASSLGFGDDEPLVPGRTYETHALKPALRFKVPIGKWVTEVGDNPPGFSIASVDPRPPLTQAILAVHRISTVFDARRGGRQPGDVVPLRGDFATWLRRHPHLRTSAPRRVSLLGLRGVQVDVTTRSSPPAVPDDCGKVGDACVPLFYDGRDFILYSTTTKGRFTVLELPSGGQIVVEQFAEFVADPKHALNRAIRILRPLLSRLELA